MNDYGSFLFVMFKPEFHKGFVSYSLLTDLKIKFDYQEGFTLIGEKGDVEEQLKKCAYLYDHNIAYRAFVDNTRKKYGTEV